MKIRASMMILVTAVAASAAHAEVIDVTYTGTIYFAESASADPTTLQNFANASGETITGSFTFDTVSDVVSNAMLGNSTLGLYGVPAVAGSANLSSTDAIYVQGTNAGVNGPRNTSISVDLSALTSFAGTDPGAFLLQGTSALAQQVDFTGASSAFPSTVIYYDGASDGSDITQIDAYLTDATVSVVPLPGALWLFGSGLAGLAALGRRRVRTA